MTPLQRELIQATWQHMQPMADIAVDMFYSELFRRDPSLRDYIGENFSAQKRLLAPTIGILVRGLDDLGGFLAALRELNGRQAENSVRYASPAVVHASLQHTLRVNLGGLYTPEVAAAWNLLLDLVVSSARNPHISRIRAATMA